MFSVLKEYQGGENPFNAKSLFRSEREEPKAEKQRLLEELQSP